MVDTVQLEAEAFIGFIRKLIAQLTGEFGPIGVDLQSITVSCKLVLGGKSRLTALLVIFQVLKRKLSEPSITGIVNPPVNEVDLLAGREIEKAVTILIHLERPGASVEQECCSPLL